MIKQNGGKKISEKVKPKTTKKTDNNKKDNIIDNSQRVFQKRYN